MIWLTIWLSCTGCWQETCKMIFWILFHRLYICVAGKDVQKEPNFLTYDNLKDRRIFVFLQFWHRLEDRQEETCQLTSLRGSFAPCAWRTWVQSLSCRATLKKNIHLKIKLSSSLSKVRKYIDYDTPFTWRFIKMQTLKLEILSEKYMFPVGFEPTYPL